MRRNTEVQEQERIHKRDELRRQQKQGRKSSISGGMQTELHKLNAIVKSKHVLINQERDIHEAYQFLVNELDRRRLQRKKRARAFAIKEKEEADALATKFFGSRSITQKKSSTGVSAKQYTTLISKI